MPEFAGIYPDIVVIMPAIITEAGA